MSLPIRVMDIMLDNIITEVMDWDKEDDSVTEKLPKVSQQNTCIEVYMMT